VEQITFRIASRLDAVPLLGQLVSSTCSYAGLTAIEGSQVEVCVVEAVNNSIKHAYGGDPAHAVELEVTVSPEQLVFNICDSGKSADPAWMHADHHHAFDLDPDRLETASESGRGLAIIQAVMDSSEYTPGKEKNRYRLVKRLNGKLNAK
jgi:serine/threonine-protein kinase RsbW